MHIFFSAGEPSGDQHAAQLMTRLRQRCPGIRCSGFGGPEMAQAGLESLYPLTELAVMGIAGVIPLILKFYRLYRQAAEFLKFQRPDAVVLVDFPGFNWWIARAAKQAGVPVYYYCPPQLWAWAPWRIRKVRQFVDCILAVLPFEARWYRDRGIDVEYVGHPFFDEVAQHQLDQQTLQALRAAGPRTVGILPGSRKQEVNRNFPIMLRIVSYLHRRHPGVRFAVACYKPWHQDRCRQLVAAHPEPLPVDLYLARTPEVIEAADCCLMVSGSVSLELLARRTPAVVMYQAGAMMYFPARMMATCKYMSLPNLIAGRVVMPEFPFLKSSGPHIREMTSILDRWLADPAALQHARQEFCLLAESVVQAGGVTRAAEVLLRRLHSTDFPQTQHRAA